MTGPTPRTRRTSRVLGAAGYHAHLDARALGRLTFNALVFVTMRAADRDTVDAFEQAVAAFRTFCKPNASSVTDYLLRVIARDLSAFQPAPG